MGGYKSYFARPGDVTSVWEKLKTNHRTAVRVNPPTCVEMHCNEGMQFFTKV